MPKVCIAVVVDINYEINELLYLLKEKYPDISREKIEIVKDGEYGRTYIYA